MPHPPRALLLIPHLNGGGAARVTRNLALGFSRRGYDVHLAVIASREIDPESLPGVAVHGLDAPRVRWGLPALLRLIWTLRPDFILSNMAHLNQAVLALRPFLPGNTRVLVRHDGGACVGRLKPFSRAIWNHLHRRADAIICQSEQMAAEFAAMMGDRRLLHILPNPVNLQQAGNGLINGSVKGHDFRRAAKVAKKRGALSPEGCFPQGCNIFETAPRMRAAGKSLWRGPGPHLLSTGRLVNSKGFDLLLSAFAPLAFRVPTANLAILGEGPELSSLLRLATRLGIADRVHLVGHAPNPEAWFAGATLYLQPSREDALPNALLEAAAAGLPLVAMPARGGMPALLRDQPGCWVAPELTALSLSHTITKALQCLAPQQRFPHDWIAPFAMPNAIERYDQLIRLVLSA